jgi:hypothetical protein
MQMCRSPYLAEYGKHDLGLIQHSIEHWSLWDWKLLFLLQRLLSQGYLISGLSGAQIQFKLGV